MLFRSVTNAAAESVFLAAVLIHGETALLELPLIDNEELFVKEDHQRVMRACLDIYEQGGTPTVATVHDTLAASYGDYSDTAAQETAQNVLAGICEFNEGVNAAMKAYESLRDAYARRHLSKNIFTTLAGLNSKKQAVDSVIFNLNSALTDAAGILIGKDDDPRAGQIEKVEKHLFNNKIGRAHV